MPYKLLVIEDDPTTRRLLRRYLESRSYHVSEATHGVEALSLLKSFNPDLIISDAEMPELDGHSLCRILKEHKMTQHIPILLMSGHRIDENHILAGFEGGADDYLLKPISMPVLDAKIKAILKRQKIVPASNDTLAAIGIHLDMAGRSVTIKGEPVIMTRKEFELLALLINKAGRVLSIPYLLDTVWGYGSGDYSDPRTVEVHISRLRKKLGPDLKKHLINVTGFGYKFDPNPIPDTPK